MKHFKLRYGYNLFKEQGFDNVVAHVPGGAIVTWVDGKKYWAKDHPYFIWIHVIAGDQIGWMRMTEDLEPFIQVTEP